MSEGVSKIFHPFDVIGVRFVLFVLFMSRRRFVPPDDRCVPIFGPSRILNRTKIRTIVDDRRTFQRTVNSNIAPCNLDKLRIVCCVRVSSKMAGTVFRWMLPIVGQGSGGGFVSLVEVCERRCERLGICCRVWKGWNWEMFDDEGWNRGWGGRLVHSFRCDYDFSLSLFARGENSLEDFVN